MRELFQSSYYWLDLLIGFGTPLLVIALYRLGRIDRFAWRLFWVGCALGLTWEIPMFVLSAEDFGAPVLVWVRELPVHYVVFLISHTFWDGGLFLIGLWLVYRLCPAPQFQTFRSRELLVLLIYGQLSELAVELSSTFNDGWAFIPGYWWSPTLFHVNGHPVTLMPQLVWFAAPIAFYAVALKIASGPAGPATASGAAGPEHRPMSGTERAWLVASELYPPFANQMTLESDPAVTAEPDFDLPRWQAALDAAAAVQPGARLRLRGALRRAHWTADGALPRVRVVDGSGWDGLGPEGAPFLRDPLNAFEGPTCEILLVRSHPARVVVRTLHATMDGRGTAHLCGGLFAALRGEAPEAVPLDPTTDMDISEALDAPKIPLPKRTSPLLTGPRQGLTREVAWRRITIDGRVPDPLARCALALARHANTSSREAIRFAFPVDLRRHRPGLVSSANLVGLLRIPVGPCLDEPDPVLAFKGVIRAALDRQEYAQSAKDIELARRFPLRLMRFLGRAMERADMKASTFLDSGVLSNLGFADPSVWSGAGFAAHRVFYVPPGTPTMVSFLGLSGTPAGLDLVLSMPADLASDGRLQRLVDAVASDLRQG